jgi:DNA-directed RNA polymerase subunit RPC12/RpoP
MAKKPTFVQVQGQPAYECSDCGHQFLKDEGGGSGSLCPECSRFGSKIHDLAARCPQCEEIIDLGEF